MDDRNGNIYPTAQDARDAGVPEQHIKRVEVFTVKNGPFKGRQYARDEKGQLRRILTRERPAKKS